MKYKLLGKTGLRVSELSLGTMTFGTDWNFGSDREESKKVFDAYTNAGGNFFDTANVYTRGTSETLLGEFIASERDNLVIASKYTNTETGRLNRAGNHKKNMVESIDESLRRLKTDYIDLYYVHIWDFMTDEEELMRQLEYLVNTGKVLHLGISDTPAWIVAKCNTIAALRGWNRFEANQIEYGLHERSPERELLPMSESYGMSVCAWGPLAAGLLSGKYLHEATGPRRMKVGVGFRTTPRNLELSRRVVELAAAEGCTPAQLSLNWVRSKNKNIITLFGARNLEQCMDNLGCLHHTPSPETLATLDELTAIEPGFPHFFLQTDRVRQIVYGDHYSQIEK